MFKYIKSSQFIIQYCLSGKDFDLLPVEMGLRMHQMGRFDKDKVSEYIKLDIEHLKPVTIFTVGFPEEERPQTVELLR